MLKGVSNHKIVLVACLVGLLAFYIFQKNVLGVFNTLPLNNFTIFTLKKITRFLVNDFLMIGVIYGLFNKRDYVKLALLVQVLGFILLLIPYLILRSHGINGPLVSFLHRLVLNPLLLILLIPALHHQKKSHYE